eukprot:2200806-Rhodomonas_salina.1
MVLRLRAAGCHSGQQPGASGSAGSVPTAEGRQIGGHRQHVRRTPRRTTSGLCCHAHGPR